MSRLNCIYLQCTRTFVGQIIRNEFGIKFAALRNGKKTKK